MKIAQWLQICFSVNINVTNHRIKEINKLFLRGDGL